MKQRFLSRKRIFLINRDFQLRYTRIAVVVGLVSTALTMFLILYPLYYFKIIRSITFLPDPFLVAIATAAIFNFFVVALMGILVTHRIAGPMYALVKNMRQIQSGRYNASLQVRKDDELKFVVRNFNDMCEALMASARSDQDRLECILKELEKDQFHQQAREFVIEQTRKFQQDLEARCSSELPIK